MAAHGWQHHGSHNHHAPRRTAVGLLLGALALTLTLGVPSAGAVVAKIGSHTYGVTPINGVNAAGLAGVKRAQRASGVSATSPIPYDKTGQLTSHGGPVMHSVTTHVIYWDPSGEFSETTKGIFKNFFTDVAHDSGLATNVFGIAGQYTDSSGHAGYSSTFATEATDGASYGANTCTIPNEVDKSAFYTNCVTDEKLQTELSAYIAKEGLPTGPTQQYVVLFPHKVVTCLPEEEVEVEPGVFVRIHPCSNNFFCAYHGSINGGTANEIVYDDIPFSLLDSSFAKDCQADGNGAIQNPNGDTTGTDETTRYADVALKYTSHEYIEAATDPLGNGWWENAHGQEIGDKCNFKGSGSEPGEDPNAFLPTLGGSASGTLFNQSIAGDSYYLQSEWDNTGKACLMKPLPITGPGFTPTAESTTVGSIVNFNASATDPYGHAAFAWDFGDGKTGAGSSPGHEYKAPGKYTVTMTPTDELTGSTATPVTHTVTVKVPQTISFTSIASGAATVGGSTYTVAATASSGLSVSFSSGAPSVCSVVGSTVSFVAEGTCTIDADQAGNEEFAPAPQKQQSFAVAKASQTVSFTSTAPGAATVGGSTYTVAATASSGLSVSFSSGAPSVCSVVGSTVSFVAAGTCTIDADQAGNAEFVAAPQASQSFAVGVAPTPTVTATATIASEVPVAKEILTFTTPTGTVALLATNISIAANGTGTVKLSCTGTAACSGRLTLTVKGKGKGKRARVVTLGTASFSIAPGAAATVTLKLSAAGRSRLKAAHGHLGATLSIAKSAPAPASTQTRTVQLKLKLKLRK